MYLPNSFQESRQTVLAELMARHPLATLITMTAEGLEANSIPLLYDPTPGPNTPLGVLRGHLARANPQWQQFRPEVEALAIFQGPQAYISPNWYPSKAEHGKAVPTWNYATVQAKGRLSVIQDREGVRSLLEDLTAAHEFHQSHPWHLEDAPADFISTQLQAIVGIELTVQTLVGKWKMSQNRSTPDRVGVQKALASGTETERAVAELVARDLT